MPWFLHVALRQLFPTGRRLPFFTVVSIIGVMLGVCVLVVVLSVMNGFGNEIRRMIVDTQGHLRVEGPGIIRQYDKLMERVARHPGVAGVAPYAQGLVMVQFENHPAFPFIQGVDVRHESEVVAIDRFMRFGSVEALDDDSVLLGSELAVALGAFRGDEIEIYSPLLLERLKRDEILLPRVLRVAGVFQTGWSQVDTNTVICTLRTMQDLYGLGDGVHGLKVRVQPGVDVDATVAALGAELGGPYHVVSWLDSNRDFLFVLQLEKNVMFFIMLFIVLVASFAICTSLLTTVVRKTREIGLLGALGAQSRQVAACFCAQGLFIGVLGAMLGLGLASVVLYFRNDVIHAFARLTQSEAALERFYQFSNLPAEFAVRDLVLIGVATVLFTTLAGVLPAWRAARLRPAEALRSE